MKFSYILLLVSIIFVSGCVSDVETTIEDNCSEIEDQYEKDSCYSETVKSEIILFVDCVKEGKTQNGCRNENKDDLVSSCNKITDQNIRDLCYNSIVFIYDDYKICESVIDENKRNECLMLRINLLSDCKYSNYPCHLENTNINSQYCNNIENKDSKIFCEAIIEEDSNKCDQINERSLNIICLRLFNKIDPTFNYEKNGVQYNSIYLRTWLEPTMKWIDSNLPRNAIITSWWDYGHTIRGIGNRETVIFSPSIEIVPGQLKYYFPSEYISTLIELNTISSKEAKSIIIDEYDAIKQYIELSNDEDVENVALILTTTDPQEAINLMSQYNSEYILVTASEYGKGYLIYNISGIETELIESSFLNTESMLYKMLKLQLIEGFEKIYSDSSVFIYKIIK